MHLLLEKGADVNAQGGEYGNALQAASHRGHEKVMQLLLENGADVNAEDGEFGNALYEASYKGLEKVVKLLLENGADVNAQGEEVQQCTAGGIIWKVRESREGGADITGEWCLCQC